MRGNVGVRVREKVKGSGEWWVFVAHHGRRRSRRIGDRRAAERVASDLRARLQLGDLAVFADDEHPALSAYAATWLDSYAPHLKPRTVELYRYLLKKHLEPALGALPLKEITRERARTLFAAKIAAGLSRASVLQVLGLLRAILNHAIEDGWITSNPAVRLGRFYRGTTEAEAAPKVEPFTAGELAHLIATCDAETPAWSAFLRTAAWTGLRQGEVLGLQWGDVDLAGGFLHVRRTIAYRKGQLLAGSPKSGKARKVDLAAPLADVLNARRLVAEADALVADREIIPWLFTNAAGQPHDAMNVLHRWWGPLLEAAGVGHRRFHDLRHTFASLLIGAGESLAYVRDQLGHSSIKVTVDLYGHLVPGANRGAVDRLAASTAPTRTPAAPERSRDGEEYEVSAEENGAGGGSRTRDLLITKPFRALWAGHRPSRSVAVSPSHLRVTTGRTRDGPVRRAATEEDRQCRVSRTGSSTGSDTGREPIKALGSPVSLGPPARTPFASDPRSNQKSGGVPTMVNRDSENFPRAGKGHRAFGPPTRTVGDFTVPTVTSSQARRPDVWPVARAGDPYRSGPFGARCQRRRTIPYAANTKSLESRWQRPAPTRRADARRRARPLRRYRLLQSPHAIPCAYCPSSQGDEVAREAPPSRLGQ